jgi:hypothetical protein
MSARREYEGRGKKVSEKEAVEATGGQTGLPLYITAQVLCSKGTYALQ